MTNSANLPAHWAIGFILAALAANAVLASEPFVDPAPPQMAALAAMAAPEPQVHPGLKFHAAPKPLAADAITQDWPCFLGPTHNNVSAETRLLSDFTAAGPPLVWEVTKGSGYSAPAISEGRVV